MIRMIMRTIMRMIHCVTAARGHASPFVIITERGEALPRRSIRNNHYDSPMYSRAKPISFLYKYGG